MQAPNDEAALQGALDALAPGVRCVVRWCDLGEGVSERLPELLKDFGAEVKALVPKKTLVEGAAPAVATCALCGLLDFVLSFDGAKMAAPGIQNDFAFIKRAAQKNPAVTNAILDPHRAPVVTMFIAQAAPMLARCATGLGPDALKALAALASGCAQCLNGKKLPDALAPKCLNVMVAAVVLLDLASKAPGGAFGAGSGLNVAKVAAAVKKRAAPDAAARLLSTLQYTTRNYAQHASSAVRAAVEG